MRIGKIIQALRRKRYYSKKLANKININYSVMNRMDPAKDPSGIRRL